MKCTEFFKDFYPKGKNKFHKVIRHLHVIYTIVSVIVIILTVICICISESNSDDVKVYGEGWVKFTYSANKMKSPSKIWKIGSNRKCQSIPYCYHCTPYASDTCMNLNQ